MQDTLAYKVLTAADAAALAAGTFAGASVDQADGYIHLSSAAQLTETVTRHFAGQSDLTVAAVDLSYYGDAVRWERSRHGQLFPHLYAPLVSAAIIARGPLEWQVDGTVSRPGS